MRTNKDLVHSLLKRKWADSTTINETVHGDGMRRVRELRAEGVNIVKKYDATVGTYKYKVVN